MLADILGSKFTPIEHAFARDKAGTINGAGFLVDIDSRYLVTNAHISGRGNAEIKIAFKDQEYVSAEAIYVDPYLDIAILYIEQYLPENAISEMDCSDRDLKGIEVAAYGHPYGLSFSLQAEESFLNLEPMMEMTGFKQMQQSIQAILEAH